MARNAIPFGLTGGIHSLDRAEVDLWLDQVESETPTSTDTSPAPWSAPALRGLEGLGDGPRRQGLADPTPWSSSDLMCLPH